MRSKSQPGEEVPGEPDEKTLSKMIDAPLGDREQMGAAVAGDPGISSSRSGRRRRCGAARATIVAYGRMVALCARAAAELAKEAIEVEVIDLRSIYPYDWDCLKESIRRTNRVIFVNEDTEVTNFGEHLIRRTVDELFYELHAPPQAALRGRTCRASGSRTTWRRRACRSSRGSWRR